MYYCNVCNESFEDEILFKIHQEIYHSNETNQIEEDLEDLDRMLANHQQQPNSRPSVIQYAPGPSLNVELHARALPGSVVTHFKIDNAKFKLAQFILKAKRLV